MFIGYIDGECLKYTIIPWLADNLQQIAIAQPIPTNDRQRRGRAIKEARGLRGSSIINHVPLRDPPPGVAEKVVGSVVIYIHIYRISILSIQTFHPETGRFQNILVWIR